MKKPTQEQMLVSIPVLCQVLVEFIEETEEGTNIYRQELKRHAKGMIASCDKFLDAVYGYARTIEHDKKLADDQNEIALQLKNAIANGIQIED